MRELISTQVSAAALTGHVGAAAARGRLGKDAVLFVDHAERRDAIVARGHAVAFAGRRGTADDAIVEALEWWLARNRTATVVTSDFGLRARASRVGSVDTSPMHRGDAAGRDLDSP